MFLGDVRAACPRRPTLSGKSTDQDSGTEVPTDSATASEDAEETEPDGPVTNSAKEVFAAALEKKKAAGQARSAHLDGHGGVGGATASHKATRTFRRKSG
jgi:hypothetical protein